MARPQLVPPLHVRVLIFGRKIAFQVIDIVIERIRRLFVAVTAAGEVLLASIDVAASLRISGLLSLFHASLVLDRIRLLCVRLVIKLLERAVLFIVCVRFNIFRLDFDLLLHIVVRMLVVLLFEGPGHGLKVQRLHLGCNARIMAREMRRLMDVRQAIWAAHIALPIVDLKVVALVLLTTVLTAGLPVTATRASQVLLLLLQLVAFMGRLMLLLSARWGTLGRMGLVALAFFDGSDG